MIISLYLVGMFGKGICAGHHGSRPLLKLAQFLSSFIQSYPGPCQLPHHTRGGSFHALDASRARDVLSQTPRRLSSGDLSNWVVVGEERTREDVWEGCCQPRAKCCACFTLAYIAPLCPETALRRQKGPWRSPCLAPLESQQAWRVRQAFPETTVGHHLCRKDRKTFCLNELKWEKGLKNTSEIVLIELTKDKIRFKSLKSHVKIELLYT